MNWIWWQISSDQLEKTVLRFQMATEAALTRHGKKITEKQMELRRMADIVIDLYAMTAVLGRASRSYSIGLPNCDHEVLIFLTRIFSHSYFNSGSS